MSAKISASLSSQRIVQEFSSEWELKNLQSLDSKCIRTEPFSPISNINVSFCFEIYYEMFFGDETETKYSCFKLNLVKLFGSDIPTQLEMKIHAKVDYSNDKLFKEYKLPPTNVAKMDIINFDNKVFKLSYTSYDYRDHCSFMNTDYLILKCQMTFFDCQYSPKLQYRYQSWVDNLKNFAGNYKDIFSSGDLSDILIKVEEKTIPAHKVILTAHSPVFKKMLAHDFLETKTNCIPLSDVPFKIVEYFLKYLYSGEIAEKSDVDFATLTELYSLAHKYDVSTLKEECVLSMAKLMTLDTVCDVLKLAYSYEDVNMKKLANIFAASHMEDLIASEDWKQLVKCFPEAGYEVMLRCFYRKQ